MLSNNNDMAGTRIGDLGKRGRVRNCRHKLQSPAVMEIGYGKNASGVKCYIFWSYGVTE
jgi:hypothetical protein